MSVKAYQVISLKDDNLPKKISEFIYDIEEDFTNKTKAIEFAERTTIKVNKLFNTNYCYQDLFGEIEYNGFRYCNKCGDYFWSGEDCDC